jgi:hypothetical protein
MHAANNQDYRPFYRDIEFCAENVKVSGTCVICQGIAKYDREGRENSKMSFGRALVGPQSIMCVGSSIRNDILSSQSFLLHLLVIALENDSEAAIPPLLLS